MTPKLDKVKKDTKKKADRSGAEKPVNLWGASFKDVLSALLKTRPMPKSEDKDKVNRDGANLVRPR